MPGPTTHQWQEVPGRPAPDERWSIPSGIVQAGRVAFVAAVASVGPAQRVASNWDARRGALVVLVALVLAVGLQLLAQSPWTWRLASIAAASAVVWTIGSHRVSLWFAIGAVLAAWSIGPQSPAPFLRTPPPSSAIGIAVLALLARRAGVDNITWEVPLLFGLSGTVLLVTTARWPDAFRDLGRHLGHVLTTVLFALMGLVAVVVPGALRRVVPHPRFAGPDTSSSWNQLDRRTAVPGRPWEPSSPVGGHRSWIGRIATVVALGLVVTAVYRWAGGTEEPTASGRRGTPSTTAPAPGDTNATTTSSSAPEESAGASPTTVPPISVPAAFANSPWYPKYAADTKYASTWMNPFRLAGYTKLLGTGGTTYFNAEDGARRTWSPPPCSCPTATVWFYGSATAMGLGQRDDFTIASQLAKRAWKDGIALHVVNKGVPGDQYWRQADRFAWDVATSTPPDLVIFYVGVSDLNAAISLTEDRRGDHDWPVDFMTEGFVADPLVQDLVHRHLRGGQDTPPPVPDGIEVRKQPPSPALDPAGIGRLATDRLATALPMGADIANRHGVRPFWFWEPMRLDRTPVAGEPVFGTDPNLRQAVAAASATLPPQVTSLSHLFDDVDAPLYFDDVHHNEEGAALVAEQIYRTLEPTLGSVAAQGSGPP